MYRQRWRTHLETRLGRRKLIDVTKGAVITLASDLQNDDGISEATAHGVLVVLRTVLRHARHMDAMSSNPFAGIDPAALPSSSGSRRERRVLREREIWRLLDETLPNYRPIVTLLSWSGLRVSESIGLRWQDVSFVATAFTSTASWPRAGGERHQ